jgi:hypothetical protein
MNRTGNFIADNKVICVMPNVTITYDRTEEITTFVVKGKKYVIDTMLFKQAISFIHWNVIRGQNEK